MNCQASIHGRFCHICGQENIETKESFWHLVTHFMYDVTHFDGKFFSTLRYLLFSPGFLSHEYLRGRRADYLHPIRMYVFTSAFFFLILFTLNKEEDMVKLQEAKPNAASTLKKLEKEKRDILNDIQDSMPATDRLAMRNTVALYDSDIAMFKRDTGSRSKLKTLNANNGIALFGSGKKDTVYKNVQTYDSIQSHLPASERDNFFRRRFARQNLHLKEKYKNDDKALWTAILDKFKHLFPQMLFVSLPLFALALQLLYIRRKNFFYVNHVVFTIHLYCGTFIIILIGMGVEALFSLCNFTEPGWLKGLVVLSGLFYWYKSLRNFYEQRRGKTVLKYALVLVLSSLIMLLIFTIFFIFSAMSI